MICILAGNYLEAERWASGQLLSRDEWFYPESRDHLLSWRNFHVIVVGSAGQNVPNNYFESIFQLAKQRGRMK